MIINQILNQYRLSVLQSTHGPPSKVIIHDFIQFAHQIE